MRQTGFETSRHRQAFIPAMITLYVSPLSFLWHLAKLYSLYYSWNESQPNPLQRAGEGFHESNQVRLQLVAPPLSLYIWQRQDFMCPVRVTHALEELALVS